MPGSSPDNLTPICNLLKRINPATVLDLGCGAGKWGVLVREYCDMWGDESRCHLVGVDVWEPYITDYHRAVYDDIWVMDVLDVLKMDPQFDLILAIDIAEHFEMDVSRRFIESVCRSALKFVIATPKAVKAQGAAFGNPYETHKCQWTKEDLSEYGIVIDASTQWVLQNIAAQ